MINPFFYYPSRSPSHTPSAPHRAVSTVLDPTIYPELQTEGPARDFVRIIQAARKQADLKVTDRIDIAAFVAPELVGSD